MIIIEQVGTDEAEVVIEFVERLLVELGTRDNSFKGLDHERVIDHWDRYGADFTAFVARDDDQNVVGVITLVECFAVFTNGLFGIINELYVDPDYRSKGVGLRLLESVLAYARKAGWKRVDVTAPPGDEWRRTVAFYEREGFVFSGPKLKFEL